MTVDDVIRVALTKSGQLPIDQPVPYDWNVTALSEINAMLQGWAAEGLLLHAVTSNVVATAANTPSYTIGASGAFNIRRPVELVEAVLTVSAGVFWPLQVSNTLARYRTYRARPIGPPREVYYDPTYTLGTITFYPTPDAIYSVELLSLVSIVPFAASTETIPLPPEYESPLGANLGVRLLTMFSVADKEQSIALPAWGKVLIEEARDGKAMLFTNNSKRLLAENVPLDAAIIGRRRAGAGLMGVLTGWY